MAAFVAKIVTKRILGEKLENKFGTEDPYFEHVPATRLDGRPSSKLKKRKKALPPGISENDGKVLTKVKRRAYRLDMALFTFMGVHFGWGSVIGLVPAFGDVMDMFMAMMVFKTCQQIDGGLPAAVRTKMMMNIVFDFFIGLVPFLGDLADAAFRANTRNALLLEQHLREKGKENLKQTGQTVPAVDPSSPEEFDRMQREDPVVQQSGVTQGQQGASSRTPRAPEAAQVRNDRGWFSRSNSRQHDVERDAADRPPRHERSRRSERHERR